MRYSSPIILAAIIIALAAYPPQISKGQVAPAPVIDSLNRVADSLDKRLDVANAKLDLISIQVDKNESAAAEIWHLSKKIKLALKKKQKVKIVEKEVPVYIPIETDIVEVERVQEPFIYKGTQPRELSEIERSNNKGLWYKIFKNKKNAE